MKINDVRQYGAISNYKKSNESRSAGSSSKKVGRKDEVQISAEAKMLAKQFSVPTTSEERLETLRQLKDAIANDNYKVDTDLLAERMMQLLKSKLI
jgi:flagellar biosynthesis anti-sigma factor FlgM